MTKNINGDIYSDLITSSDPRKMAAGSIPRQKIDRIIIHHNATTNKEQAVNTWLVDGKAQTSAHYEVADNEIIGIVGENTTAWHAGNAAMNARSIGIENLNATGAPNWTISDATFNSLVKLVVDIAKRYGFKPDAVHVMPHSSVVPTACPGGIDMKRLISEAMTLYFGEERNAEKPVNQSSAIEKFKQAGDKFTAFGEFTVDEMKFVNGIWQAVNYDLAGSRNVDWTNNGIPLDILDNVTRGNVNPTQVGDKVKFGKSYASGTIDQYDQATNAVGINYYGYGLIWFNADEFIKL